MPFSSILGMLPEAFKLQMPKLMTKGATQFYFIRNSLPGSDWSSSHWSIRSFSSAVQLPIAAVAEPESGTPNLRTSNRTVGEMRPTMMKGEFPEPTFLENSRFVACQAIYQVCS